VVDGKQMLKELKLSPSLLEEKDVTLIEDLLVTAIGEAQRSSQEKMAEAYSKVTGDERCASPMAVTSRPSIIDLSLLEEKDVTLIEDLLVTAIGEAQRSSQEKMAEAYSKVTGGFNLPI